MRNRQICFIGGGNMACSLIGGLIDAGAEPLSITVGEPDIVRRDQLTKQFGVTTFDDNKIAMRHSDTVILAVKPQIMETALTPLTNILLKKNPLLISIAAGVTIANLELWVGGTLAVVRVMPNTPALVNSGISALFANLHVTRTQHCAAESIMSSVGTAVWVERETLIDTVTSVSGSGPAYFFYLMEAMEQAAIDGGLEPDIARRLTLETALGAARLALSSNESTLELRRRVTSPGGTTEAAICVLDEEGTAGTIKRAINAARERSSELAKTLRNN